MTELYTSGPHAGQSMYREKLVRIVQPEIEMHTLCICGQNPSTAEADDPTKNDPTTLREMGFARRLGFGRLVKVNSSDRRSTDAKAFYAWIDSLSGWQKIEHRERCFRIVLREARAAEMFIAAWGNCDGDRWPPELAARLIEAGVKIHVFGLTSSGAPKHTLARGIHRIPDDARPFLWRKK